MTPRGVSLAAVAFTTSERGRFAREAPGARCKGEIVVPSKQRIRGIDRRGIAPRDFDATAKLWRQPGFQVTIRGDAGRREASLRAVELIGPNGIRLLLEEAPGT